MDVFDWKDALSGDGEAFGRVYDRHRDRVFRHSLSLVPNVADAQDVLAVVFLEAWRKREQVRFVDGSVLPWLLVTATNTTRNLNRSHRRHRAMLDQLPKTELTSAPADQGLNSTEIYRAIRNLPRKYQDVAVLCLVEGFSEAETAVALDVPAGTVKSRLSRARGRLGETLAHLRPRMSATLEKSEA